MTPIDRPNFIAFLEMAGCGTLSGRVSEWPQLIPATRWAVERISHLEAENERLLGERNHAEAISEFNSEELNDANATLKHLEAELNRKDEALREIAETQGRNSVPAWAKNLAYDTLQQRKET